MKQAFNTQEAHDLIDFRERPQIEMILNSVQRGLVVRRSELLTRENNKGNDLPIRLRVPMFPAVSALFLARASLVLSNPIDPMFGTINGYFLRLSDHHGAYKDITGLPAFISLFSSSSDSSLQAQKERLWALELLRDGTVDEYSYKIASRRYAPTLLFTSFDSLACCYPSPGDDDREKNLLIETIETILNSGGRYAAIHMMRMGLLPWIRGVLAGRHFSLSLHTLSIRFSFLKLISTALDLMDKTDPTSELAEYILIEISGLFKSIVHLYFDTIQSNLIDRHGERMNQSYTDFCGAIYKLLHTINLLALNCRERINGDFGLSSSTANGIEISVACSILSETSTNEMWRAKVVSSIVVLPFRVDSSKDLSLTKKFCISLLSSVVRDDSDIWNQTLVFLLRRISLLSVLAGETIRDDPDIISLILSCQLRCMQVSALSEWKECLISLLSVENLPGFLDEIGNQSVISFLQQLS
uniref:URB1 C-terminal domain-containing protein n=1 Tax=Proboscia inermis TaxID=420281 RepID=A0A7S0C9K5_9STRA|mmetsp:Transcript_34412/g.34595  ORF Transcript_34412/g.34595 Transcript_34412/m.34595 type:complete len:471 (+) Transcript_34412:276-1688(+)|eukprot:CAMPEP_0171312102 /NCGR_PEP_ID=MMETSP0816-20121228/22399_1 /TAXON_ID=420281 /ORGANISM="Proboscia inermis, Strain CCAP1064/1" /LENGTH=470 /DNA_ID=CAMNT_0011797301 /DNA_START=225 /DNA_END=1637 /DNA_ORIENTATION=-